MALAYRLAPDLVLLDAADWPRMTGRATEQAGLAPKEGSSATISTATRERAQGVHRTVTVMRRLVPGATEPSGSTNRTQ